MSALQEIEKLMPGLNLGERALALSIVAQSAVGFFPGISSNPKVCGGDPCIVRTRIPVWLLEQARRLGATEQILLDRYPHLTREDIATAWTYARSHVDQINLQIEENEAE